MITVDDLRQKNAKYNSKWLFPVHIAAKNGTGWEENIILALGKLRRPIDEIAWNKLLAADIIAAEGPEKELLQRWWTGGWKETPQIEGSAAKSTPILRTKYTGLGEELDIVYPNITIAAKELKCHTEIIYQYCSIPEQCVLPFDGKLYAAKSLNSLRTESRKEKRRPWTLFDANNTIVGHFANCSELAASIGTNRHQIEIAHRDRYNYIGGGLWVWYEEWGLMPISPNDEPLGKNWRTKCAPKNAVEGKIDF